MGNSRPTDEHALLVAHTQSIKRAYTRPEWHGLHVSKHAKESSSSSTSGTIIAENPTLESVFELQASLTLSRREFSATFASKHFSGFRFGSASWLFFFFFRDFRGPEQVSSIWQGVLRYLDGSCGSIFLVLPRQSLHAFGLV